ncbi:MAG: hypothetical protein JSR85_06485 [Proteobacteria bacterium]|nr:hypothetical protein [Pseudomonadota bacterium]
MSIIYRAEKGSPLSVEEIDGNFRDLETRLKTLEEHPEAVEGIGKVQVEGDQLTLIGTFGTDFGTFALPKTSLRFRGKWFLQALYQKHDIVTHEEALYICLKDHTSVLWDQDRVYHWQEILSFPKFHPTTLSLYEKATLPNEVTLGTLAILVGEESPILIFFNGKRWQYLLKGEIL